jgi:hypothetical protein
MVRGHQIEFMSLAHSRVRGYYWKVPRLFLHVKYDGLQALLGSQFRTLAVLFNNLRLVRSIYAMYDHVSAGFRLYNLNSGQNGQLIVSTVL